MTLNVEQGYREWDLLWKQSEELRVTGWFREAKWWISGFEKKPYGTMYWSSNHSFLYCLN